MKWNVFWLVKSKGSIIWYKVEKNMKLLILLLSFNSQICNKGKYMVVEHFKVLREMLLLNSYNPIHKVGSEV